MNAAIAARPQAKRLTPRARRVAAPPERRAVADLPVIRGIEDWLQFACRRPPVSPAIQLALIARLLTDPVIRERLSAAQAEWVLHQVLGARVRSNLELEKQVRILRQLKEAENETQPIRK